MLEEDLYPQQVALEKRMASLGVDKFRDTYERETRAGRASDVKSIRVAMNTAILPLTKAIDAFKQEAETGKAGRRHSAVKLIGNMESHVLAFLTVKVVMDNLVREQKLTSLAVKLGNYIEVEKSAVDLKATEDERITRAVSYFSKHTHHINFHPHHAKGALKSSLKANLTAVDDVEINTLLVKWSLQEKTVVGLKLIELLCQSTGLFKVVPSHQNKKTINLIVPTESFLNWLEDLKGQFELLMPEYLPCIIPPKDWTGLTSGGYHSSAFAYDLNFVKTRSREHKAKLEEAELSLVYSAVNTLQRTPWAINRRVLEVAFHLMNIGSERAGIAGQFLKAPPKPHDIDTNEEVRKAWSREATRIWRQNTSSKSKRLAAWKTITMAQEFCNYDKIYFPYQLDFRGRIYAVPAFLNPQSTDLAKGLLHFSEGDVILDKQARDWLAIHGANCFGIDKVSYEERLKWVQENEQLIIEAARDPLDEFWWSEADSPFCFLAFCFEWQSLLEHEARGEAFISHLPIAIDGSCNGLQHYAAMLQDAEAGRAVNLTPSPSPQDIYGVVASKANEKLKCRKRGGRKRALGTGSPMTIPQNANQRWSLD